SLLLYSAQWAIGEQRNAVLETVIQHASVYVLVVPEAQLDLDRRDVRDPVRLLDLSNGDVAEADMLDQPIALERVQRAHARSERHTRIRRVQLIEIDAVHPKGAEAGLTRRRQVSGTAVGDPIALRSREPSLRRDANSLAVPAPSGEGSGDEALVVPDLFLIP